MDTWGTPSAFGAVLTRVSWRCMYETNEDTLPAGGSVRRRSGPVLRCPSGVQAGSGSVCLGVPSRRKWAGQVPDPWPRCASECLGVGAASSKEDEDRNGEDEE